jgi:hypothetical protein
LLRLLFVLLAAAALHAQSRFFPVGDLRAGMQGIGKTVFSGNQIEEFKVEILGVLENAGPKQSLVLVRLSGGPLASTGILQGMSGSPVYIDGHLLGAVAMTFSYSKEPIAAVRPIEDIIRAGEGGGLTRAPARASLGDTDLTARLEPAAPLLAAGGKLVDIATPVSLAGFARATVERFAPRLQALGLEPQQGLSGGGRLPPGLGKPSSLQPGSMISVQLMTGDMSVGADGTVTHIDGDRFYAFGHKLLSLGSTDIPFARSEVLALIPSLSTSFKISAPREWMGTLREDRDTGVAGWLGRKAAMVPLTVTLTHHSTAGSARRQTKYEMEMVSDTLLSPVLVQMAVASAIQATERTSGAATLEVSGEIRLQDGPPIRIANTYSGDSGLADQAALAAAVPLAYALQFEYASLRPQEVRVEINSFETRRQVQVVQAWTSRREARAGESVDLTVVMAAPNGQETTGKVSYRIPQGARPGTLYFTVSDGGSANAIEYRQFLDTTPNSARQLVAFLNGLRDNTKAYVRVWRPEVAYGAGGYNLPSPPPSAGQILSRMDAAAVSPLTTQGSKVAELEVGANGMVVSGSKTVQVEIVQ